MDGSTNFMPELWAKIEHRKSSASIFSRGARVLVTAALAASAILSFMVSMQSSTGSTLKSAYMEALVTEGETAANLPNPALLTDMEQQ
jgi:hypothetical protein